MKNTGGFGGSKSAIRNARPGENFPERDFFQFVIYIILGRK